MDKPQNIPPSEENQCLNEEGIDPLAVLTVLIRTSGSLSRSEVEEYLKGKPKSEINRERRDAALKRFRAYLEKRKRESQEESS